MSLNATAQSVLASWHASKPVIALMGEFSAGKSTLLNFLLDGDHLPTKVTATNLPSVWVTHSETQFTQGLRHDGTLETVDVAQLGEDVRDTYLLLRYGISADILKRVDIVDTPGISDPKLAKGATLFLGEFLDSVLWLSPANQAWRQTEKAVWTDFPAALHRTSLIVLTRADKMRRANDLNKVMKRVKQETNALFQEQVALNTPLAVETRHDPTSKEWETSGGKLFMAAVEQLLTKAEAGHAPRAVDVPEVVAEEREKPAKRAPRKRAKSKPKAVPAAEPIAASAGETTSDFSAVAFFQQQIDAAPKMNKFSQIKSLYEQITARLDGHSELNPVHRLILKQCLCVGENENANVERLIEQSRSEMADFDRDFWCIIAP